jgi:hypothetical protein
MERPDLTDLLARLDALRDDMSRLDDAIELAYQAALGIDHEGTDVEPSGDEEGYFTMMKHRLGNARNELGYVEESLLTAVGHRTLRGRV